MWGMIVCLKNRIEILNKFLRVMFYNLRLMESKKKNTYKMNQLRDIKKLMINKKIRSSQSID